MNIFKRILFAATALCCAFGMSACGGENEDASNVSLQDGEVTEKAWEDMIAEMQFENVTFSFVADPFIVGNYDGESGMAKLDGDRCSYVSAEGEEEIMDAEVAASVRNVYVNTSLAILNNFEDFAFNAEKGAYESVTTIGYEANVQGVDATIIVSNVLVTINENDLLATIDCDMEQYFDGEDGPTTFIFHVVFTFSNYGTTVING